MDEGRDVIRGFLATAEVVADLLGTPEIGSRWDLPSVLPGMTVGELAAHLARAVNNVDTYLGEPSPSPGESESGSVSVGELVDGPGYFLVFEDLGPDVDSNLNRAVRERARAEAAPGWPGVREALDRSRRNLTRRLADTEPAAPMKVLGSMDMVLAQYLRTRLIEMAVHLDDLAVSIGTRTPTLPEGVTDLVIGDLVTMARRRHGDPAVLRALTRRERDEVEAMRVL